MLRALAQAGGGAFEFFDTKTKHNWAEKVACQVRRMASPGCSSVSVKWQQFNPTAPPPVQAPKQLHALFNNYHTLVYGFVPHCTQATLLGNLSGQELQTMVSTSDLQKTRGTFLHKLTARALIRDYEDGTLGASEAEHEGKKVELKHFIIELSKEFSILSQFTSFVAIEERDSEQTKGSTDIPGLVAEEDVDFLPYVKWMSPEHPGAEEFLKGHDFDDEEFECESYSEDSDPDLDFMEYSCVLSSGEEQPGGGVEEREELDYCIQSALITSPPSCPDIVYGSASLEALVSFPVLPRPPPPFPLCGSTPSFHGPPPALPFSSLHRAASSPHHLSQSASVNTSVPNLNTLTFPVAPPPPAFSVIRGLSLPAPSPSPPGSSFHFGRAASTPAPPPPPPPTGPSFLCGVASPWSAPPPPPPPPPAPRSSVPFGAARSSPAPPPPPPASFVRSAETSSFHVPPPPPSVLHGTSSPPAQAQHPTSRIYREGRRLKRRIALRLFSKSVEEPSVPVDVIQSIHSDSRSELVASSNEKSVDNDLPSFFHTKEYALSLSPDDKVEESTSLHPGVSTSISLDQSSPYQEQAQQHSGVAFGYRRSCRALSSIPSAVEFQKKKSVKSKSTKAAQAQSEPAAHMHLYKSARSVGMSLIEEGVHLSSSSLVHRRIQSPDPEALKLRWTKIFQIQHSDGYWELTTELGKLINVDVDLFANVFLKSKGIQSLGVRAHTDILRLVATLLVLQLMRVEKLEEGKLLRTLFCLDASSQLRPERCEEVKRAVDWVCWADRQYPCVYSRLEFGLSWESSTRQLLGYEGFPPFSPLSGLNLQRTSAPLSVH